MADSRIQQIGGQLQIENSPLQATSRMVELFQIMHAIGHPCIRNRLPKSIPARHSSRCPANCPADSKRCPGNPQGRHPALINRSNCYLSGRPHGGNKALRLCQRIQHLIFRQQNFRFRAKAQSIQSKSRLLYNILQYRTHLIAAAELSQPIIIRCDLIGLSGKLQRNIAIDPGQLLGQHRHSLIFPQTFLELLARNLFDMQQNLLQASIGGQQLCSRLGTYSRNTRYIVRGIPHKALQIDELRRNKSVGLLECRLIIGLQLRNPLFRKHDGKTWPNELERVPIAGHHQRLVAFLYGLGRQRANDVIRLIAGLLHKGNAPGIRQLMQKRNLRR